MLQLLFLNPAALVAGRERRSKLLDPNSALYWHMSAVRGALERAFPGAVGAKRMDFHVELLDGGDNPDNVPLLCERAQALQGTLVPLVPSVCGKAVVYVVPGTPPRHATIAHFGGGVPEGAVDIAASVLAHMDKA